MTSFDLKTKYFADFVWRIYKKTENILFNFYNIIDSFSKHRESYNKRNN